MSDHNTSRMIQYIYPRSDIKGANTLIFFRAFRVKHSR